MNNKAAVAGILYRINKIDWQLLAFMILFMNVKLVVKAAAIIMIYILRPDLKFGFRLKHTRLPLFYPLIISITFFNWLISGKAGYFKYDLVVLNGLLFWALCILAAQQVKLAVEKNDPQVIHNTILVFLIINAIISLVVYTGIIIETGHIDPYRYQGDYQKYFIGTGDYIKGITLDTSTTNAVFNAFGVIYFLLRDKYFMALLCMVVMLLTGSNITDLLLLLVFIYLFIFQSHRNQKSIIVVCLLMTVLFWTRVSPQNNKYIKTAYQKIFKEVQAEKPVYLNTIPITVKPDSILNADERRQKVAQLYIDSINKMMLQNEAIGLPGHVVPKQLMKFIEKPVIPKDSIHTPRFQHKKDTSVVEKNLLKFIDQEHTEVTIAADKKRHFNIPGKIIALEQTMNYFKRHPLLMLTGTGIGNFSSKLAFRATGMHIAGGYPAKYTYINEDFKTNHLDLYLYYFTNRDDLHSLANSPNSTFDQLLSEYGLVGLLGFLILYIGFFLRQLKKNTYGFALLLLMAGHFFAEYWFEQLSVVVFFELLLFLNIKEAQIKRMLTNNEA